MPCIVYRALQSARESSESVCESRERSPRGRPVVSMEYKITHGHTQLIYVILGVGLVIYTDRRVPGRQEEIYTGCIKLPVGSTCHSRQQQRATLDNQAMHTELLQWRWVWHPKLCLQVSYGYRGFHVTPWLPAKDYTVDAFFQARYKTQRSSIN